MVRYKPALFARHKHLFAAFAPQLVHVQLHAGDFQAATAQLPHGQSKVNWAWEEYSRAAVSQGLRRIERLLQRALQPSDVVMVADVDEVPRRAFARSLRLCAVPLPAKMSMAFFYYSLRSSPNAARCSAASSRRVIPPVLQVDVDGGGAACAHALAARVRCPPPLSRTVLL